MGLRVCFFNIELIAQPFDGFYLSFICFLDENRAFTQAHNGPARKNEYNLTIVKMPKKIEIGSRKKNKLTPRTRGRERETNQKESEMIHWERQKRETR